MKFSKLPLLLLGFGSLVFAQNQKYTMAEAVNGLRSNLAIKSIPQFSWTDDAKSYIQGTKNAYLITEMQSMKADTLVSLYQINKNLSADQKLKSFPQVKFTGKDKGYFTRDGKYFRLEKSGTAWKITEWTALNEGAENVKILSDNKTIVYTVKNNLYLNKNGKTVAITNDENSAIVNGQAVHRSEFGIDGGIFASPGNSKIAFYRMDESMVTDYPIIDWASTPAKNVNIKYPMAGNTSHQVTLGVYDINSDKKTFLNIEGDKEQYLTAITWSPDSKYIFVGVLNRDQNHMKMNQY
ncbi:MAG: DPP IV N-terminal domain-containing protein, partial [Kaistella sp.]